MYTDQKNWMAEKIFNYILKNFEVVYGIEPGIFNINYGIDEKSKIQIKKGDVSFFMKKEPFDLAGVIWKEWNGEKLPFLFDSDSSAAILTQSEDMIIINYDIISSGFYLLSNWQEYLSCNKDSYGRFRVTESIQYKLDFICKPVVNYYFDILKNAIEKAYNIKINQKLWQGKTMAVCLTHDIDLCESAWIQGSFREFLHGNLFAPFKLVADKIFSNDSWFNFNEIVEIEKGFNSNSTFFFLPFKGKKNGIPNADYNILKPKFKNVLRMIEQCGSEIGIHGSIGTSTDLSLLKAEINKIGMKVNGNRFHFLFYDSFISPSIISESGLKYDSTLGFAENIGFRNSYCLPFYLYDMKNNRTTDIVEIPLAVMDVSFGKSYMGISKDEAFVRICDLINEIERFNGCFTLLWHNTYFSEYKFKGWKNVYHDILDYCSGRNAVMTSGKDVYNMFVSGDNKLTYIP
jgi:hypothetical protein